MEPNKGRLVIGVDVGGTNTDSVLLDLSRHGAEAVVASHKAATTAEATLGVHETLRALLEQASAGAGDVAAVAVGTTHFLNAIVERDRSRVQKVAVLRLASHGFSRGTPPFADWPAPLRRLVEGHAAIVPGGIDIGGSPIASVDERAVREQAAVIRARGLRSVVVVGVGAPMDDKGPVRQEHRVRDILRAELGRAGRDDDDELRIVCSHEVAGPGLLARENASILNAAILGFARRTLGALVRAMHRLGLCRCPLYLTSNAGHLLTFSEAVAAPIRIFSSGATNSMRGAAFLVGRRGQDGEHGKGGCVVVDVGGTTTDVGSLLRNGYPRLAGTQIDLAGVRVNLEMPSVESIGLGGGSVLHVAAGGAATTDDDDQQLVVRVGPDSVAHELTTRALCFGGATATATDAAVVQGSAADVGTHRPDPTRLPAAVAAAAQARIKKSLEAAIDRAKTSPDPCAVVLVGGGSILCPRDEPLAGVARLVVPRHAGVANAIGAAIARIHGAAEMIAHGGRDEVAAALAATRSRAVQNAVDKGGDASDPAHVTVLHEEASGVPYVDGQTLVKVEVACPADHERVYREMMLRLAGDGDGDGIGTDGEEDESGFRETKPHEPSHHLDDHDVDDDGGGHNDDPDGNGLSVDLEQYRPSVSAAGVWTLSQTDLRLLSIGCYILGCGGGGATYAPWLELRQLLLEGEAIRMVRCEDLADDDVLPPVANVGTPAVGIERPGGDGVYHSMQEMEKLAAPPTKFTRLLAIEIGGMNGVGTLIWGSSRYYDMPTVDGDLMGRAYPSFEMVSQYVLGESIDDLFPVTLCSGTGHNVVIPKGQRDAATANAAIRDNLMAMGAAAGATGAPLTGARMRAVGIPNTYSLAWRLGRAVLATQQARRRHGPSGAPGPAASPVRAIIEECGGDRSARLILRGKIRAVESRVTTAAYSVGRVTVERLAEADLEEGEMEEEGGGDEEGPLEVEIPFMNENLSVVGKGPDGSEEVVATVPELIFLLDAATGENVGVQEYRYGLKVLVVAVAPHPVWATPRGLEIAGPRAFGLPYDYVPRLEYTKPRSVIDEFRPPPDAAY